MADDLTALENTTATATGTLTSYDAPVGVVVSESQRILWFLPDWMFFFIACLVALVVYYFLPDEFKQPTKRFLKEHFFHLFLLVFVFYGWSRWGLVGEHSWIAGMKYALFLFFFLFLLYFSAVNWLYEQRYYTNQFVCNNIKGSCNRIQEIGNAGTGNTWVILWLGTCGTSDERWVFPWQIPQKIVVVPKSSIQFLGNQIKAMSQVDKVDLMDMPEEVCNFLQNDTFGAKWCEDELYFGLWDIEEQSRNPSVVDMKEDIKKLNSRINELNVMLKGKLGATKGFVNETMNMTNKLQGKSGFSRQSNQRGMEE